MDHLADRATLVLSELLTNAVQHAKPSPGGIVGSEIGTRFYRLGDAIRLEVHDVSEQQPKVCTSRPLDERGRGLLLVDALTGGQWGVSARDGLGKCVWACVSDPENGPGQ